MNNNRNNRRRGRGNRSQSGGNQVNRIDSRARGNAPQMLDKFKKLAQDAQHNGDRVQAEYYLQFADHYFRVISDSKPRQEEGRTRRPDDRDQTNGDDDEDFEERDDFDNRRPTRGHRPQRERQEPRSQGEPRFEGEPGDEGVAINEGEQEPPVAEAPRAARVNTRGTRRPPRDNRPIRDDRSEGGIDAAILPPSIGVVGNAEETPEEKRPRRRLKVRTDGGDDLQTVG